MIYTYFGAYSEGSSLSVQGNISILRIRYMPRKYHIDEFPQLINILKGDMSFMGPLLDIWGFADQLIKEDCI